MNHWLAFLLMLKCSKNWEYEIRDGAVTVFWGDHFTSVDCEHQETHDYVVERLGFCVLCLASKMKAGELQESGAVRFLDLIMPGRFSSPLSKVPDSGKCSRCDGQVTPKRKGQNNGLCNRCNQADPPDFVMKNPPEPGQLFADCSECGRPGCLGRCSR